MATIERLNHRGHRGAQGKPATFLDFSLCSPVTSVVKVFLFPRRSPSLRARRLLPLRSLLRNRVTCPSREPQCRLAAGCARRCCRESDGVGGNIGASRPDFLCMAGQSSSLEFSDFPIAGRLAEVAPVRSSWVRLRFLLSRHPR